MHPAPRLSALPKFPATAGWCLAALGATIASWTNVRFDPFVVDVRTWHGEPWRLVISALPHLNVIHLLFNLSWMWIFGTFIESVMGWRAFIAMAVLFAATSAAAEHALFNGGVGSSGVVYGFFGFLWVMGRRDRRFAGAVDSQTAALLVAWFVLCCVLTLTGVWRVGNAAHAAGALFGMLLGLVLISKRGQKWLMAGTLAAAAVAVFAGATTLRPSINMGTASDSDMIVLAYLDLQAERNEAAVVRFEEAVRLDPTRDDCWFSLGIALHRLDRLDECLSAYQKAIELKPNDLRYRKAAAPVAAFVAYERQAAGTLEDSVRFHREALALDPQSAPTWYNLAIVYIQLKQFEDARAALESAVKIDGQNPLYRKALDMLQPKLDRF